MTMRVNVITTNERPGARAFNCPLLATRQLFSERGFDLRFLFATRSGSAFDADVLFVNSDAFRQELKNDRDKVFSFLDEAVGRKLKIFWFDTTEGSSCSHFDVLPYVDCLMKGQLLTDRSLYLKGFRTGSLYTDFFDEFYKCGETPVPRPLPDPAHMHKLAISWNSCFENYGESRFALKNRLRQSLRRFTALSHIDESLSVEFFDVNEERPIDISCRVGPPTGKPSHIAHRKAIAHKLKELGADTGMIPPSDYFDELRRSKLSIGPFGNGEISSRDYEAIICGAALVKPDMSHMETWPELFQVDRTFVPHKWDLSDLKEKVQTLLDDSALRKRIAWEGQDVYRQTVSYQGLTTFTRRLVCALESRL